MSDQTRVPGLSKDNAILLLAAAEELDLDPAVVATSEDAFMVPPEVAEKAGFDKESGLPSGREAKKAAKEAADAEQAEQEALGGHDVTLTDEEVEERQKAAQATSQEGAMAKKATARKSATSKG